VVCEQVSLLPAVKGIRGILQPVSFGHVGGLVYGAAFPYVKSSMPWDGRMQDALNDRQLTRLWLRLLEVHL
jgi:hypothetical protein